MSMAVTEVIALPEVTRGEPVVLSDAGADREVRWVHISDVADMSNLLEGGEIVLTTGDALRADPRPYLTALASTGALGVIAEFHRDWHVVPPRIGEFAASLGLTLVILRREVRFVDITERVHRTLVAEQYEAIDFARRTHEVFTELTLGHADAADITDAAAELLGTAVVLENLGHQAVASSGALASNVLRDWERRSRQEDMRGEAWLPVWVGREGDRWARLIAVQPGDRDRTVMVLERAAQALEMARMAERDQLDLERQAQAGLIDDVLRERIRDEKEVLARAVALGFVPAAEYVPAALRVADWPLEPDPVAAQRRTAQLLDIVVSGVRAAGHTGLFSVRDFGEVRMVLSLNINRGRSRRQVVDDLARALVRDIGRITGLGNVVVGSAASRGGVSPAIGALAEAREVAQVAASMPASGRIVFEVSDIRIRGLVSLLRNDPRAIRFAESELRDLILHDIQTGTDHVDVLRAYLRLAGNKSALAAHLHLSRPAVYSRLARIEAIVGDLSDGESMTSLHVALLILDAQSRATGPIT
ncbi:PucR family transcriptional regulator [Gordonia sp. (in: high G+C Gram-positive bacteria)]|uniref:PucR family transcriptional regulator n=2 Tax=Gordonia sp. (in: high G+C Gram-positive bacteria) TaxID=84139 RepID=UPI001D740E0D|nr:PucR family transcriptional regulator [Gordonia sp. (in: high G+C Gram-positive bacteria)]MCB1293318.1 PucR family transcriptional regulator [Gordonia sp. (in: high G+C Gram-positive bacteria)]HMS75495.1 PucR family transcriptional regulator [Gordonia sp. (in: high G+C Gram-positive bacteria)]